METLKPNTGEKIIQIPKHSIYAYITDYGYKYVLKEIRVDLGQHTWYWILMKETVEIDLCGIADRYCTFDKAINMAINNSYATVYKFDNYSEMMKNWDKIVYVNAIRTIYTEEEASLKKGGKKT